MAEFGDILAESWKEYKANFKVFLVIFLLLAVIPSLIVYSANIPLSLEFLKLGKNPDFSELIKVIFSFRYLFLVAFFGAIAFLFSLLMHASLIYNSVCRKKGKRMEVNETLRGGAKYFWKYLLFSIVFFIFLGGLFLLFIIPGIIFLVYWLFAPYVLIKENKGIIESLRTSYCLIKGKWWRTFGYSLLFIIIIALISVAFSIAAGLIKLLFFINSILTLGFVEGFKLLAVSPVYLVFGGLIDNVFGLLSNLVTIPLSILFFKNFYLDYKIAKSKKRTLLNQQVMR